MNLSKQRFSTEEIKKIDIVDYVSRLGQHPTKIRNADEWYLSPLRNGKNPSFKINRKINRWYDHGLAKGGNMVDFGALYYRCILADFLQKIDTNLSFHQPVVYSSDQLNGKTYYGIGKNDSGGYEIRSPYFKASSSPKDVTTFNNGAGEGRVF